MTIYYNLSFWFFCDIPNDTVESSQGFQNGWLYFFSDITALRILQDQRAWGSLRGDLFTTVTVDMLRSWGVASILSAYQGVHLICVPLGFVIFVNDQTFTNYRYISLLSKKHLSKSRATLGLECGCSLPVHPTNPQVDPSFFLFFKASNFQECRTSQRYHTGKHTPNPGFSHRNEHDMTLTPTWPTWPFSVLFLEVTENGKKKVPVKNSPVGVLWGGLSNCWELKHVVKHKLLRKDRHFIFSCLVWCNFAVKKDTTRPPEGLLNMAPMFEAVPGLSHEQLRILQNKHRCIREWWLELSILKILGVCLCFPTLFGPSKKLHTQVPSVLRRGSRVLDMIWLNRTPVFEYIVSCRRCPFRAVWCTGVQDKFCSLMRMTVSRSLTNEFGCRPSRFDNGWGIWI